MTFTIVHNKKIKDRAPIYVRNQIPDFKTTLDRQKYWASEKQKWAEGIKIGDEYIPGPLYFFWQELKVKNRVTGAKEIPVARQTDLFLYTEANNTRNSRKSLGVLKGRGVGLSTFFGANANYFLRMYPGSRSVYTSVDKQRMVEFYNDNFLVPFESLHPNIAMTKLPGSSHSSQEVKMVAGIKHLDEFGREVISESTFLLKDTVKNPSGLSGVGSIFGAFDELPLHPKREDVLASSLPIFQDPRTKELIGFPVWGGTIEHTLTNEQLIEYHRMIETKYRASTNIFFMPFWMSMYHPNGWCDEKWAMEWWEKEAQGYIDAKDEVGLRAHKMNNPRTLDDIWDFVASSRFESDVAEKIKLRTEELTKKPPVVTKYILTETNESVVASMNKNGTFHVIEEPKDKVEYVLLIDGIETGTDAGSDKGSKAVGMVVKLFDPDGGSFLPVAHYADRPKTVEETYRMFGYEAKYYNKYKGLRYIHAEARSGTGEHFLNYLKKIGMHQYAAPKMDISKKGYIDTTKKFSSVNQETRIFQYRQANLYFRKYGHDINCVPLLMDCLTAMDENADYLDAFLMLFLTLPPDFDKPVKKAEPKVMKYMVFERQSDGSIKKVWKERKYYQ